MNTLCLHAIQPGQQATPRGCLLVLSENCFAEPAVIWMTKKGDLRVSSRQKADGNSKLLASLLFREAANSNSQWLLAPLSSVVMHNGIRPLSLAIIEPGDVLAFENQNWLTSELWRPAAGPVPDKVAEMDCSVCGGALKLASVIQCPCGRYYHLEDPNSPDDPQLLNCYLKAGMCGLCERTPSLDAQFLPIPPEELISWDALELAIETV